MKDSFLMAIGLMLVFEGLLPLLLPEAWRQAFLRMTALKNGQLRFMGLISVLAGLVFMLITA